MRSTDEIISLYTTRSNANGSAKAKMRNLRDYYNGDVIVPLPEAMMGVPIGAAKSVPKCFLL